MTSFIELEGQGIFIKPESIVTIEPIDETRNTIVHLGGDLLPTEIKVPAKVLIRTNGREMRPYGFECTVSNAPPTPRPSLKHASSPKRWTL